MKDIFLFTCILCLLYICKCIVTRRKSIPYNPHNTYNMCVPVLHTKADVYVKVGKEIPVWMYWSNPTLPLSVQACLANWEYYCSKSIYNFVPKLVTDDNLEKYIDSEKLNHPCISQDYKYVALKSDFIRLLLLEKYGGVYMDASVFLTETLDWIIGDGNGASYFQAFFNERNMNISCKNAVIENSFLVAPPNHELISLWLKELYSIDICTHAGIMNHVSNIPIQKNLGRVYHVAYHCLTNLFVKKPINEFKGIYVMKNKNYLNFLVNNMKSICHEEYEKMNFNKILKFISHERSEIDSALKDYAFIEGSFVDEFMYKYLQYYKKHTFNEI